MSINPETTATESTLEIAVGHQVKPAAPPHPPWEFRSRSAAANPDPDAAAATQIAPHRTFLRFCGCSVAVVLMAGMLFLILLFTAFRIKDPHVAVASIVAAADGGGGGRSQSLRINGTAVGNATFLADVKVRNPNVAAFRFGWGETAIYYGGVVVGEARTPPGRAKARGTVHLSVAVEILGEKLSGAARLTGDVRSGTLRMICITRIPGDVKIITKKHMVVKAKCAVNYDYATGQLTAGRCIQYIIS